MSFDSRRRTVEALVAAGPRSLTPLAFAALLFLGACGGGSNSAAPGGSSVSNCPGIPAYYLVYPQSGSVGVSSGIGSVIVGGAFGNLNQAQVAFSVIAASGTVAVLQASPSVPPSPLPSPLATVPPNYTTATNASIQIPTLQPKTTYAVSSTYSFPIDPTNSCTATAQLGSFTTQ